MPPPTRPNYGIDSPAFLAVFGVLAVVFFTAGVFIGSGQGSVVAALGPWVAALICTAGAAWMIYGSTKGKPKLWARALDGLGLKGMERALDVGCGRGMVLMALAERLPKGKATGIDIWRNRDQSGNARVNTELNATIVGVEDRVEIIDADMKDLPFEDASFDVVTASLSIRSLPLAAERAEAMKEIIRVLRPGGRVVIVDNAKTVEYDAWLRDAEFDDLKRSGPSFAVYPPVRTVTATKPRKRKKR